MKTLVKVSTLFAATLIFMAGCAANSSDKGVWYNPNKTPEQILADQAECRNMVRFSEAGDPGTAAIGTLIGVNNRSKAVFADCMIAKGYQFIPSAKSAINNK